MIIDYRLSLVNSVPNRDFEASQAQILYIRWYRSVREATHGLHRRHHPADKPNHQLAAATWPLITHRLRGRRHRWAISMNPSVSHKPAPAPSSASKPTVTAIESRHEIVICTELTPPCAPPTLLVEFHYALPSPSSSPAPVTEASYRSRTPRVSYSSSGSPSALSSGPAATSLAPTAVKTEGASPGRSRTGSWSWGHLMRRRGGRMSGASARKGRFVGTVLARWWQRR